MKKTKRILAAVMAVLSLSLLIPTIAPVQAATTEKVYVNYTTTYDSKTGDTVYKSGKTTLVVRANEEYSFRVYSKNGASKIKSLKPSSKNLVTKITYTYGYTDKDNASYSYRDSTISFYAKKKGSYKITFKVASKTYTIKVKALSSDESIEKATYGSEVIEQKSYSDLSNGYSTTYLWRDKVSASSGKFSVTANKDAGYQITGLVVVTANAKGNPTYKAVKNGKKITLSKGKMKYTEDDVTRVAAKKYTYIYVSYKNTTLGTSVTYSVAKNPETNKKAVKRVTKYSSGDTTTSYFEYGNSSDFAIWK